MLDLKWIRENPKEFDAVLARRDLSPLAEAILEKDERHRLIMAELQMLQARRNDVSRHVGDIKKQGGDAQALMDEVSRLKERMVALEDEQRGLGTAINALLMSTPNAPDASVPDGMSEEDNKELFRWGTPRSFDFPPQEHDALGTALGLMDFETAAKLSGSRFVFLKGSLARLERALAQFMLDLHTQEHGYTEVNVPVLVQENAMLGTGQLPKFAEDLFQTTRGDWLISTAEIPLTNTVADMILEESSLPVRLAAFSLCFRSEAGAAGKDTRGMIRHHQFEKIELVSIVTPECAAQELERMTTCAETVLQKLTLPYRKVVLCTGDIGFSAAKTYDLEVWLPGQNRYREISSCSMMTDFQARRMKARYRPNGEKGTRFVHTLNGSGVAVGRCLVAVLENYQCADGSIVVPEVLRPYMGGVEVIKAHV